MRQSIHDLKSADLIRRVLSWAFVLTAPALIWAQADPSLRSFTISDIGNPQSWKPGELTVGEGEEVVITAVDEFGDKVEDFDGVVYLKQETDYGPGRIEPDSVRLENGEWAGTIRVYRRGLNRSKSGEIGDVWIELTDLASQPHVGISNMFTVLPEPFSQLLVVLPGEEHAEGAITGKTGQPLVPRRGTEFTVQVISTDRYWNRIHSVDDLIRISSSNPSAVLPSDSAMSKGKVTMSVSFGDAGLHTLTAIDLNSPIAISSYSQVVEIGPSDPDALAIAAYGANVTALQTSQVLVTVTDDAGNRVPGTEVQFEVISGTGNVSPSSAISDADGIARTTFTAGQINESNLVRAIFGSLTADVEIEVNVGIGIAASQESLTALQTTEIIATLGDDDGNRVSNTEVQFTVVSGTGTVTPSSAVTDSFGIARTVFQAGEVSETNILRATFGSLNADIEVAVTVGIGIAADDDSITALQTTDVVVTLGDGAGNRVPNSEVRFAVISGTGTVSPSSAISDSSGIARTVFQAGESTETNIIRASFGSAKADLEIMVFVGMGIVASNAHLAALQSTEVVVTVGDNDGNRVPNSEVQFAVIAGTGTVNPTRVLSDSQGMATTVFQGGQLTETNIIRATFGSASADVEVMVTVTQELPDDTIVNYPNPFGLTEENTSFDYHLSEDADVALRIYDLFGNLVWSRDFDAGTPGGLGRSGTTQPNSIKWDGRNDNGQVVGSGGYILVAKAVANRNVIMETKRKIALIR